MGENIQQSTNDILRIEGIRAKGYGIIPKAAMIDRDLSIAAKAIYAYFCSLSGRGETVFPGREKILADLRISKDAYYKGLKELTDNGYVTIAQERSRNEDGKYKFQHNVYTITACPSKYKTVPADVSLTTMYEEISELGIQSQGYGISPYAIMSDSKMKYQPKAVYGYLASHIGQDKSANLDARKIAFHLGILKPHTVQGYMKQLAALNYITVTRLYENGRLISKNRYTLVEIPGVRDARTVDEVHPNVIQLDFATEQSEILNAEKQDTENPEILNAVKQDTESPEILNAVKQDTESPKILNAEKQDAEKQDAVKQDTIITSITITSNKHYDDDSYNARVKKQIGYDRLKKAYDGLEDNRWQQVLDSIVAAIAEVYAAPKRHRILVDRKVMDCDYVSIQLAAIRFSHVVAVMERTLARIDAIEPKNYKSYMLTSVYRELSNTTTDPDDGYWGLTTT